MRRLMAVTTCLVSASLGALAISRDWATVPTATIIVGGIWAFTASWLAGQLSLVEWRRMKMPLSEVFAEARRGELPTDGWLVNG